MNTPAIDLRRRAASREPKQSILVVHRGGIEGHYLHYLKRRLDHGQLSMVEVSEHLSTDAARRRAQTLAKEARLQGSAYDRVWCKVAEADPPAHPPPRGQVVSLFGCAPCFETWLLMHFETVDPVESADSMRARLDQHLPNLTSAPRVSLDLLDGRYETARVQSARLSRSDGVLGMHDLVGSVIDSLANFQDDSAQSIVL
jgi:hypothetical protein